MSLIEAEQDDLRVLEAEDAAIRDADKEPPPEGVTLAAVPSLIEDIFNGDAA